ncbi:glutathione S-transferase family protein [Tianweitania sp. BSSL-BM11]|uniref:Glutathione S-transferase family protein n=1 Tax=Tianweitania aestuarii TaxID=2814886 RepID=A0ABS5RZC0_9HYPH|nr:glutathione S-transferase family protein [Tianweitania aestuarii]MBS9721002.1 glutathione S-transferase family protein [Tianweitania aestuarii]
MLTLYSQPDSGNCYKPRLLLGKLGRPFRHVTVSSVNGETRTAGFLAKNPNGKVPLLELDDGQLLAESNAMLLYLGEGTRFVPEDAYQRALTYQWLFFEQYSHEPFIAVRRALTIYPERAGEATPEKMAATLLGGNKALQVMDTQLAQTPFLVGDWLTVADIALFAYTQDAAIAGFEMRQFPHVEDWLGRVRADTGHVPMDWLGA